MAIDLHELRDVAIAAADAVVPALAADDARDDIARIPGVAAVNLMGARDFEIAVEVREETLRRYGLTLDAVAAAIRASSLALPGGETALTLADRAVAAAPGPLADAPSVVVLGGVVGFVLGGVLAKSVL